MLNATHIKNYNKQRKNTDKSILCHAPFVSINFEQNGNMTACCYNRYDIIGRYPYASIAEAWNSPAANKLREYIKTEELDGGCSACRELIEAGNYSGTKAIFYDEYAKNKSLFVGNMPKVFEFELQNTCNLECVMCNGYFSSTIRKNREKMPSTAMVYDAAFVEQVAAFMPSITDMKFLGGEPFLIDIYYDIWEKILEVNPNIKIHITTNGTILNERAKRMLERLKVGIILSLDSVDEHTYTSIRKNANYTRMMENLEYFRTITKRKDTYLNIAACVMRTNWRQLPQLLEYANSKGIKIHFNTVWRPHHLSLKSLDAGSLGDIIDFLVSKKDIIFKNLTTSIYNYRKYNELIQGLIFWRDNSDKNIFNILDVNEIKNAIYSSQLYVQNTVFHSIARGFLCFEIHEISENNVSFTKGYDNEHDYLYFILHQTEPTVFAAAVFNLFGEIGRILYPNNSADFQNKIDTILALIPKNKNILQLCINIIEEQFLVQVKLINETTIHELLKYHKNYYNIV